MRNIAWGNIPLMSDVDEQMNFFNEMILQLFNKHAPITRSKICTKHTPWITENIKLMISLLDKAHNKALSSKSDANLDYYRALKNYVTGAIEREKRAFFTFYINNNKNKPKRMWDQLKRTCPLGDDSANQSIIPHHLCDPNKINDIFLHVPGNDSVDSLTLQYFEQNKFSKNSFEIDSISQEEIAKTISNIKTRATGHDSISIDMIQLTLPFTLPVITEIVNNSIKFNKFPDSWKIAKIKSIPKSSRVEDFKDL
ncbi:hypothetical protein HF086_017137 [Spodoptera exigua]|uniref:Uncharacterized protein n=1 Tax=Spodoptera exigua TaxID=7107 RepID=A0A922MS16_SPOEX|nr:hypothetical protein HF086_017137 [Spodoptera exigua]